MASVIFIFAYLFSLTFFAENFTTRIIQGKNYAEGSSWDDPASWETQKKNKKDMEHVANEGSRLRSTWA